MPDDSRTVALSQGNFEQSILLEHQRAREDFGVVPLVWDAALARDAYRWAAEMARTDAFKHSPKSWRSSRQGENIWYGSRGAFSYTTMAKSFTDEVRFFRPGRFPQVSSTGNWADVGHYTAIIWPTTTHVGCAVASNARYDYLVCRYNPSGNIDGVHLSAAR
ncbi:CAP domain-containing protein [Sphingomicrobium sp. XHP0239]|uniref:CAP domain-containing protein n=1 Tax=Sphingomicrobium maritimum TaxID=3133972 RepID=UPI0031CCA5F2